jgi:hypothetical protein
LGDADGLLNVVAFDGNAESEFCGTQVGDLPLRPRAFSSGTEAALIMSSTWTAKITVPDSVSRR